MNPTPAPCGQLRNPRLTSPLPPPCTPQGSAWPAHRPGPSPGCGPLRDASRTLAVYSSSLLHLFPLSQEAIVVHELTQLCQPALPHWTVSPGAGARVCAHHCTPCLEQGLAPLRPQSIAVKLMNKWNQAPLESC